MSKSSKELIVTFRQSFLFSCLFTVPFLIFMIAYSFLSGTWKIYNKVSTGWVVSFSGIERPLRDLFFEIFPHFLGFLALSTFIAFIMTWHEISTDNNESS